MILMNKLSVLTGFFVENLSYLNSPNVPNVKFPAFPDLPVKLSNEKQNAQLRLEFEIVRVKIAYLYFKTDQSVLTMICFGLTHSECLK